LTNLEWASGDRSAIAQWDYGVTSKGIAYHKIHRQTPLLFSESRDQAEWGDWYWATDDGTSLTYQAGADISVRQAFASNGRLSNTDDANYRAISNEWPVFGFAHDLGFIQSTASVLFSIGLAQSEAVQYTGNSDTLAPVPSLWTSYFSSALEAVSLLLHITSSTILLCGC
jgi:hypothetical protein